MLPVLIFQEDIKINIYKTPERPLISSLNTFTLIIPTLCCTRGHLFSWNTFIKSLYKIAKIKHVQRSQLIKARGRVVKLSTVCFDRQLSTHTVSTL